MCTPGALVRCRSRVLLSVFCCPVGRVSTMSFPCSSVCVLLSVICCPVGAVWWCSCSVSWIRSCRCRSACARVLLFVFFCPCSVVPSVPSGGVPVRCPGTWIRSCRCRSACVRGLLGLVGWLVGHRVHGSSASCRGERAAGLPGEILRSPKVAGSRHGGPCGWRAGAFAW